MEATKTLVWQCEAFNTAARQAADQFAAGFFAEPRKVRGFDMIGMTFKLSGGVATYECELISMRDNGGRPAIWRIFRRN